MSYKLLLPQTATVSTITDGALTTDRNWTRTETTTSVACRLEQLDTSEPDQRGVGVVAHWRIFLPAGTAVTAADEVTVEGRRFQVVGTPDRVYAARAEHHVEATLLYVADVAQT
jgi:hypothetical protein